jgi:tetratricopeptide (TPR) repeat protein
MSGFLKSHLAGLLAAGLWLVAAPAPAQAPEDDAARLDELYADLAEPDREDWEQVEAEITRFWSNSGSPAMDLLLQRGNEALEAKDYPTALEHFSALVDHAPEFAEGWNARATVYFMMGDLTLSIADVQHVLTLNPRHFGALTGLGFMMEAIDEPELALEALHAAQALNPNQPEITQAAERLEKAMGDAEL